MTSPAPWETQHGIDLSKHQDQPGSIGIEPFVLDRIRLTEDTCTGPETFGAAQLASLTFLRRHSTIRSPSQNSGAPMGTSRMVRRSLLRAAGLASATIVALAGFAVTAEAGVLRYWNSQSTPLTVSDDGREKGQGYGTWKIGTTTNGTRSQSWGYLRDRHDNGHKVYFELKTYVNSGICFSPEYTSCQADWYYHAKQFSDFNKETWGGSSWSPEFYASTGVSASASYARGRFTVAESNGGPDLHSGPKYTKGNAY